VPMSEEKRREFDRLLRQERMQRRLRFAPTLAIGAGAAVGFAWLATRSAPPWVYLAVAVVAGIAKPIVFLFRYLESRERLQQMEDSEESSPPRKR
jgi:hypothetical protein